MDLTQEQVDAIAIRIIASIQKHSVEQPMTKRELAKHLKYSIAQIDKLMKAGIIKPRRLEDGMDPRFFLSEIKWK